jgi:hypothetical protein
LRIVVVLLFRPPLTVIWTNLEHATMHKRVVTPIVVGVALLFSQEATVLIAMLCPHLRSPGASCFTEMPESATSHEHMDHMEMDPGEGEPIADQNVQGIALDQPVKTCPHCALHWRSSSNLFSLRETETAKRTNNVCVPSIVSSVVSVPQFLVAKLTARAHGPPGELTPRHILINIFRI